MEITGTVTRVGKRVTEHGSVFVSVQLDNNPVFKYLKGFDPIPEKGTRVTISGIPMLLNKRTNIGGNVRVRPTA